MTEINPETGRRPRAGRPLLLNDDLTARIVQVVEAGNYLKTAAQFCGVSQASLQAWLARGRAAAAQVETHTPGALECPLCHRDRTDEVRAVEQHNAIQEEQEDDQPRAYAALGSCPQCGSHWQPTPWELPEAELPFLTLLEQVTVAETKAEVAAVTHWRRAFTDDWRAARDYLARKRPDQWAAKTTVAISSEEAEQRIEAATMAALTALGVDTDGAELSDLDSFGDDPPEEPEE